MLGSGKQIDFLHGNAHIRVLKYRCYVKPVGAASGSDMKPYFGHKVGLIGTIKAHPAAGGALVEFTGVTKLD